MNRIFTARWLTLIALGLIWATPVQASEDTDSLRKELDALKSQVDTLSSKRTQSIEKEVEAYLDTSATWSKGAQGDDAMSRITISASFLANSQNTVGLDDNTSVVNGFVELGFHFAVTEGLDLVVDLLANTDGHMPMNLAFGPTLAGAFDGIGVDSTRGVRPNGDGVQIGEAFIRYAMNAGNTKIDMEMGLMDPRTRYLTTAFSDDYRTSFMNNEFVDPSAISWISRNTSLIGADVPDIIGIDFAFAFGANKNYILRTGIYNTPGEFFDRPQWMIEFHWVGEVSGRAMNVKLLYVYDNFYNQGTGESADGNWGFEWDWLVSDKIGVWLVIAGNNKDVNPVEMSGSIGMVYTGVGGNRPDDQIGLAIGYMKINEDVTGPAPEDTELVVEAYYRYMAAKGNFQVTPYLQFINNPGGKFDYTDSTLFILGIRFYVPF